ncbi:MAG: sulfite exporter TauE/SafE family protein [Phycisphaerales bacterium]|nr:sulfite exporter TauE/SafE family protein [Phycisphaerales bacterium]
MTPFTYTLIILAVSIAAGLLGSLLGLGGGIIITPVLTLFLGVPIKYAIGATIISVIATSSGAAATYVKEHMTNLRLAILLSVATTAGALTGGYLNGLFDQRWLFIIFGIILGYSALMMFHSHRKDSPSIPPPSDPFADKLHLHGHYFDHIEQRDIHYRIARTPLGLFLMYIAGVVSGLLGIGSGALKVPALDLAMRLPFKVSTATSNFMMGITAAASAGLFFARGRINPLIAAPVSVGVLCGAVLGAKLLPKIHSKTVRIVFIAVLLLISGQMIYKGIYS